MKKMFLLFYCIWGITFYAQTPMLVKNAIDPNQYFTYNSKVYFIGGDIATKRLWVTDGTTSGTKLVLDSNGNEVSSSFIFGIFNGKLYFSAYTEANSTEMWSTDGTAAGTKMLKDIHPTGGSSPSQFTVAGTKLFFTALDDTHGREWWVTDGTTAGTHLTYDQEPSQGIYDGSFKQAVGFGNKIIYSRNRKSDDRSDVWISDGESAPVNLTAQFTTLYYIGQNASELFLYNNNVFFSFYAGTEGDELYSTDGTVAGTKMINLLPGSSSFYPDYFFKFNDKLCFQGYTPANKKSLFVSDGTLAGTVALNYDVENTSYAINGNTLYFAGATTNGVELCKTDGTPGGTSMIKNIRAGTASSFPSDMFWANGKLYFTADDGVNKKQPWVSDGTEAGTIMLKNIFVGNYGSLPQNFTEYGGAVYFTARTGENNFHLFKTDGTTGGTAITQPVNATVTSNTLGVNGSTVTLPIPPKVINGFFFFAGNYFGNGRELCSLGGALSTSEVVFSKITIYPNPVKDVINIAGENEVSNLVVLTPDGRKILERKLNGAKYLDVSSLTKGIYLLQFYTKTGIQQSKIIKN